MFEDTFFGQFILPMTIIILLVFIVIFGFSCISSIKTAQIYNQINHTNYTASDFFWAGEQINIQTQTINLKSK